MSERLIFGGEGEKEFYTYTVKVTFIFGFTTVFLPSSKMNVHPPLQTVTRASTTAIVDFARWSVTLHLRYFVLT